MADVPRTWDVIRDVLLSLEVSRRSSIMMGQLGQAGDLVMEVRECLEEDILELQQTAHLIL